MDWQLVGSVILGCLIGIITGIVPGLHVNTVSAIALSFVGGGFGLAVVIASMAIVHSFVDFIPTIIFGVPSEDNFLSVLPGQRLFLQGQGHYAVMLASCGGLIGGIVAIIVLPILLLFTEKNLDLVNASIPLVLCLVMLLMLWDEKGNKKRAFAILIIALSAALGIVALGNLSTVKNPLLVLVTGFFGAGAMLHALRGSRARTGQRIGDEVVSEKNVFENSLLGLIGAGFVSLFPGIGPSQAALTIRIFAGKLKTSSYLVVLGCINTANVFFSMGMLYAFGKTRTGAAAAIKQLGGLDTGQMITIAAVALAAIGFGALATLALSKWLLRFSGKFDYRKINAFALAGLFVIVLALSNLAGFVAFLSATMVGFAAISLRVKRSHCMAFLIVPTIARYYFGV